MSDAGGTKNRQQAGGFGIYLINYFV